MLTNCTLAGNTAFVAAPTDLDGPVRIVDGDGDDVPIVDMEAYEAESSPKAIPTVSAWGMVVLALLVVTVGSIVHQHRNRLA